MSELFKQAIVQKRNVLNELRSTSLTLQELRFFSIYLSKINPRDKDTRIVRFPLSDFKKIMEYGKLNIKQLKDSVDSLLGKKVFIPLENGGLRGIVLFEQCEINEDSEGEWYVEISASTAALPLMFDFKDRYFKYELWNALRLSSANQIRMYEILKQYKKLGRREIPVSELREMLGIAPDDYPRWDNFKMRVLDGCQKALKETTDISYTYKRGKSGKGGKWLSVIFYISKNTPKKKQLELDLEEFIDIAVLRPEEPEDRRNPDIDTILDLYPNFTVEDVQSVYNRILKLQPDKGINGTARIDYFKQIFDDVKMLESHGNKIRNYAAYINKILDERIRDMDE